MNKRSLLVICFALAAVAAATYSHAASKPNIVYILADDMGQGDVAAYNQDSKIPTPNIDRLAADGMRFTDPHTSSGVCTPTRYGILTGRYSWRTGMKQGVLGGMSPHLIDPSRETVASFLKEQGYQTACIGKWHLGMDWADKTGKGKGAERFDMSAPVQNGPLDVGFDYYFGIAGSLNMSPHAFIDGREIQGTLEFLKTKEAVKARGFVGANPGWAAKEFVQDQVLPTFTQKTCDWIRAHADEPFFVYMPLNAPHSPIVPSKDFIGKSGLNDHGDFCMETDWAVGEVLNTLDELGIADNTIVIFTTDNGTSPKAGFAEMAKKGHHSSWIYRGMKGTNWEGGHRVPFIVRWPEEVKAGTVSNQVICTTDLLATCAAVTGIELPDDVGEDSISFLPALKGGVIPEATSRVVVHHSDKGIFSVRYGKWKLMFDDFGGSNRGDPRKDDPIQNAAKLQLFDMSTDATEDVNVAAQHPEVVDALKQRLAEVIQSGRSTAGAPQPTDLAELGDAWTQLDPIRTYLK
ncbi:MULTISPECIES: arylsulfatase [unclassified Lentimonas]|uniref:sulfatase family protein n=1 Tax=unclassified Lentimonas TaxID=2630993 RepID=UPI00132AF986|nr:MULTISPECIES: arylsulfatase [unclassified Lentimonas]CAA6692717.1 Choline-sulfatase (EC [Lentimonas sp. CC10]CAA6696717.1 Choline-sulfatase (EC [Lentimonas sp. CC19]CAA7072303.1 Choline-sulfatase (EC [Lentimonas sp. CC11]